MTSLCILLIFDTHLTHLDFVFSRLHQHGLKLKPEKCHLLKKEVQYLGHHVSEAGVVPDPEKVTAVENWPFLGLAGYYRRFIKDNCLHDLLSGIPQCDLVQWQSPRLREWTEECAVAFARLKQFLVSAPMLAFADFELPFVLYTDASQRGLWAVLAQVQDGKERLIAYASRSLHPSERNDRNYSSFKLEFLTLKWAVAESFLSI